MLFISVYDTLTTEKGILRVPAPPCKLFTAQTVDGSTPSTSSTTVAYTGKREKHTHIYVKQSSAYSSRPLPFHFKSAPQSARKCVRACVSIFVIMLLRRPAVALPLASRS